MTVDDTAALGTLRASSSSLLADLAARAWGDTDVAAPSLLPGWTRGHVLTHLARNADSINRTLTGALAGQVVARYPDGDPGRDADIEAGCGRPAAAIVADLTDAVERLDRVLGAVDEADGWDLVTDHHHPARRWLLARLDEVEIHRVDLGTDYSPVDWPAPLVVGLLPEVAADLAERTDDAIRVLVLAEGSVAPDLVGAEWIVGTGDAIDVRGPDWAVLAWLTGRPQAAASRLTATPALRPW